MPQAALILLGLMCLVTVSEGLDASFLPLRQSDMCLVCIAFASWVLKTANPQAGDAWKAGMYVIREGSVHFIQKLNVEVRPTIQ